MPSASGTVFRLALNGALESVSNVVHAFESAGLRWKTTSVVLEPAVVDSERTPEANEPGSVIEIVGALLSIVTDRTAVVVVFPAMSVTRASRSVAPSGQPGVFRVVEYGEVES